MNQTLTLANGVKMPAIGFGTYQISPDEAAEAAVRSALEAGYRHIDTARLYDNERGVGKAIRESGIPREEIFVTTKLWNTDHPYEAALRAFDESLSKLGLDYVDLYLIHWPGSDQRGEAWRALEEIYKSGRAKSIGVSNYTIRHLNELLESAKVVPMVNQFEFHPFLYDTQKALLAFCKERNIVIEAYSPLSRHSKTTMPEIEAIASRIGKTPSQVMLRWCVQHGTAPLPRSTNTDHIQENLQIFDFELSDADMQALDALSDGERVAPDPEDLE